MRQVERSYKVNVSEEFIEDTFDPPAGLDPLGVAKQHSHELENIAIDRATSGQQDTHGRILVAIL